MTGIDENMEPQGSAPNRPRIVRTAPILAAVAIAFYIGFIAIGVMRS